jgi:hypothetical protein
MDRVRLYRLDHRGMLGATDCILSFQPPFPLAGGMRTLRKRSGEVGCV